MTHALDPNGVIAARVKTLRTRNGWSAQRLGEEMAQHGVKWDRSIVANFESGRRASLSGVGWLALAYVLDVAPVHLLFPVDAEGDEPYRVVPDGLERPTEVARDWVRGWRPVGRQDKRRYYAEVPANEHRVAPSLLNLATSERAGEGGRVEPIDPAENARERALRQRAAEDERDAAWEVADPNGER